MRPAQSAASARTAECTTGGPGPLQGQGCTTGPDKVLARFARTAYGDSIRLYFGGALVSLCLGVYSINVILTQESTIAAKAELLRFIAGIGPVSAAMLLAEVPVLGRMTAGEAVSMTGLTTVPRDSGAMRRRRMIAGGRRALRHVLFQAVLVASCHNPILKAVAKRFKEEGRPHKLVIIAITRRLITIANAVLKSGTPWQHQPGR